MKTLYLFLIGLFLAMPSASSAILDVSGQESIVIETGSILKVEFSLESWKAAAPPGFPLPSSIALRLLGLPPSGLVENGEFADSGLDLFVEAGAGVLPGGKYKAKYADFDFHDGSTVLYQGPGFNATAGITFAPGSPHPNLVFDGDRYTFLLRNTGVALTVGLPNIPASLPNILGALQSNNGFSAGAGQPTGVWLLTGADAVIVPEPGTWMLLLAGGVLLVRKRGRRTVVPARGKGTQF